MNSANDAKKLLNEIYGMRARGFIYADTDSVYDRIFNFINLPDGNDAKQMIRELYQKGYTHVKIKGERMKEKLIILTTQETLFDKYWIAGNILVTRNHDKFLVINELYAISNDGKLYGLDYTDSLHLAHSSDGSLDIMAVYSAPHNLRCVNSLDEQRLLWEREE